MADPLITAAELLSFGLAATALAAVDAGVIDAHRGAASDEVRSRLAVRYEVPSDWTAGGDTKRAIAAIAAASLLGRRGYDPRAGAPADPIGTAARDARAWLDLVVDGRAILENSSTLTERRGPLVAGTDTTAGWSTWRRCTS